MKDIPGYEKLYAITEDGEVWSYPKAKYNGLWLKQSRSKIGYLKLNLYKNKKLKSYYVHVLVMLAFKGKKSKANQVNHIDGNKLNNSVGNLEYCTASQNQLHARGMGLIKPRRIFPQRSVDGKKWIKTERVYS